MLDQTKSSISAQVHSWQHSLWRQLTEQRDRIGHALLLHAMPGFAKRDFALNYAAWQLCSNPSPLHACGHCQSCIWMQAGTHPNFFRLGLEVDAKAKVSQQLKIDQVRLLNQYLQQQILGWKVVIIEPVDRLNLSAANALLKNLEEPSSQTLFILISDHFSQVLATIRSRCQHYDFSRVDFAQVNQYVMQTLAIDRVQSQQLLALTSGAPLAACELYQQAWYQERALFSEQLVKLISQPKAYFLYFSQQWQQRLALPEFIQLLNSWLRDCIANQLGYAKYQTDLDWTAHPIFDLAQLFEMGQKLNHAEIQIGQNVQAAVIFDALCATLSEIKPLKPNQIKL